MTRRKQAAIASILALCALLSGCPSNPTGSAGQDARPSYSGPETAPEGLTEEVAADMAAITTPVRQDVGDIVYFGAPLFPSNTAAKLRDQARGDCSAGALLASAVVRVIVNEAINLARETPGRFPEGNDPTFEPPQDRVAYVRNGKQLQTRTPPDAEARCNDTWLFGLDCSGYTKLAFAAGGIRLPDGTHFQNNPANWNDPRFGIVLPAELDLVPIFIPLSSRLQPTTGDIATFVSRDREGRIASSHNGIVVARAGGTWEVWNSSGSKDFSCEVNMNSPYGPGSWSGGDILGGHKLEMTGVVRLVPSCAAPSMVDGGDNTALLDQLWDEKNAAFGAALTRLFLTLRDCEDDACQTPAIKEFKTTTCPLLREMFCLVQRKAVTGQYDINELGFDFELLKSLLEVEFPDGSSCGCP